MSDATDNQPRRSWRERLFAGLTKTRQQIGGSVRSLFARGQVDDELLEDLEALLLSADVGVEATIILIEDLRQRARVGAHQQGLEFILQTLLLLWGRLAPARADR